MQRGLSAIYPALISTVFNTKDVHRFPDTYTGKNLGISAHGIFHIPKTVQKGTDDGGVFLWETQFKRHNFG